MDVGLEGAHMRKRSMTEYTPSFKVTMAHMKSQCPFNPTPADKPSQTTMDASKNEGEITWGCIGIVEKKMETTIWGLGGDLHNPTYHNPQFKHPNKRFIFKAVRIVVRLGLFCNEASNMWGRSKMVTICDMLPYTFPHLIATCQRRAFLLCS